MKLNIQLFAMSKSTTFTEPTLTDANISDNKSTLKIKITFSANNNVTFFSGKTLSCTCNGSTQTKSVSLEKGGSVSKTFTFEGISHDADGKKTVSWSWSCATGTSVLGTVSDNGTKTLQEIPRASEIDSISDVNTQGKPTVIWTPKNSSFKYKVKYLSSDGITSVISSIISPNQTTPYTYSNDLAVPNEFFTNVKSSTTQTATATLYTYKSDGTTLIGEKSKTFTVTLISNVKPHVWVENLTDVGTVPAGWNLYVKGKSKLRYDVKYYFSPPVPASATITSSTNGESSSSSATISTSTQTKQITTSLLNTTGSNTITARVTDSRGRYTDATNQTYTVVDYFEPKITTAEARRVNSSNVEDTDGQYLSIKFVGEIASVSNKNAKEFLVGYRVKGSNTSFTYKTISSGYSVNVTSFTRITDWALLTTNTYEIVFEAIDSFRTSSNPVKSTRYLDTGFDLMNFNANGKAMAIGKVSEATGDNKLLEIALPTTFSDYTKINSYYTGRGCIVGNNSSSTSTLYYKYASIKQYGANADKNITFKVFSGFGDATTKVGILTAHFRVNGSKEWSSGELKWEYANSGIDTSHFLLGYKNVAEAGNDAKHVEVELYVKIVSAWTLYHFEVICEGQRETRNSDWTLYNTTTNINSIEFTTITSTLGYLKNNTYGYTKALEAYDGRISNANIPHYYDNGNAHMKLLISSSSMNNNNNKPNPTGTNDSDGYIMAYNWDNSGHYSAQYFIPHSNKASIQHRGCLSGTWSSWEDIYRCKSLYDNSSGTNASITNLSETTANFKYLEIIYKTNDGYQKSTKVYTPNDSKVVLDASVISGNYTYVKSAQYSISGTSITLESNLSGQARIGNNVATQWDKNSNRIYIIKVLGYR